MTATMTRPTKKFKLLRGTHVGPDPSDPKINKIYEAGEVIEAPLNLEHFNDPRCHSDDPVTARSWAGAKKYELLPEQGETVPPGGIVFDPSKETPEQFMARVRPTISNAQAPVGKDNYDNLSEKQLRQIAEESDLDVKNLKSKEQLIAALRSAS